jgi:hypothetical protein
LVVFFVVAGVVVGVLVRRSRRAAAPARVAPGADDQTLEDDGAGDVRLLRREGPPV